jgi:hypothetical protein
MEKVASIAGSKPQKERITVKSGFPAELSMRLSYECIAQRS